MRAPFQSRPMVKCSGKTSVLGSSGLPPAVSDTTGEFALESPSSFSLLPGSCFLSYSSSVCVVGRNVPKMLCAPL